MFKIFSGLFTFVWRLINFDLMECYVNCDCFIGMAKRSYVSIVFVAFELGMVMFP